MRSQAERDENEELEMIRPRLSIASSRFRNLWCFILLAGFGVLDSNLRADDAPAGGPAPLMHVLSHVPGGNTVGGEIREAAPRADGYYHIDTPRMIARLRQLHVNNVNYLIWNSPSDFDDLRQEFLPTAQSAGISVWVYLAPPGETAKGAKGSDPFRTDYEKWAQELAALSLKYPALQAWCMDDFTWSMKTFTPAYVAKLRGITRSINSQFRFIPVVHFTAVTRRWVADYGALIDGVMCPYIDLPWNDTQRTSPLDQQINNVRKHFDKPIYVLIYAGRHLASPLEPSPRYVADVMKRSVTAMDEGRVGGIISYGTPLDEHTPPTESNSALDGFGRLSLAAAATTSTRDDFAEASQIIRIDPRSARYQLSVWHYDQWGPPDFPKGQYQKQVLIDGKVVWACDPAADVRSTWLEGSILTGPIDLTTILKGKTSARLTLRLQSTADGRKQPIDVGFDRLSAEGFMIKNPGFESDDGWALGDNGRALLADIDHADPDRPAKVFQAVSEAFGRASHVPKESNHQ
jgi:hypothetical protein